MERPSRTREESHGDAGVPVALGLGSNVGDRIGHLQGAVESLAGAGGIEKVSSIYESPPAGYADQGDFLNLVVILRTGLTAGALLESLRAVEEKAGRRRPFRNAPRTLDIDIILFGDEVIRKPELSIPHPRWRERPFVLVPLLEVAPRWQDPVTGRSVRELAGAVPAGEGDIWKVAPPPRPAGLHAPGEASR